WARGKGSSFKGKNKYPLRGKPLIWYPLKSLKVSNTVNYHYVFTDDDEIAETTLQVGWRVIPRPEAFVRYDSKKFNMQKAWEHITRHIARDLDIPLSNFSGDWITAFHLLSGYAFQLNCNNCMLKKNTFKGMLDKIKSGTLPEIYPAVPVTGNFMIEHAEGHLFPLWHGQGLNRQFYPPLYNVLLNTKFTNVQAQVTGRPNYFFYAIEEIEAMDVHHPADIEFIECYLETHPDHFGFELD
ncbi:MAG: hypothetical protein KJ687_04065, partial [Proteobacteria bacterium]|nr:hypothetical protein [Pseudomonadota bacterium]